MNKKNGHNSKDKRIQAAYLCSQDKSTFPRSVFACVQVREENLVYWVTRRARNGRKWEDHGDILSLPQIKFI